MSKLRILAVVLALVAVPALASAATWSLNDDWDLSSPNANFGCWSITMSDVTPGMDPFTTTTVSGVDFSPYYLRGFSLENIIVAKVYDSETGTTPVAKPLDTPTGYGLADAGDVVIASHPGRNIHMKWIAPHDGVFSTSITFYNIGPTGAVTDFLMRNGPYQPPINPEGEQYTYYAGFNAATGRRYWTVNIADCAMTAGQEVLFWQGNVPADVETMIGIEEFTVTEIPEPATLTLLALGSAGALRRRRR